MGPNLDLNINALAKNFYSDAIEREFMFDKLFEIIVNTDGTIKSTQHTKISKTKLLTFGLFAFETILKSLYILSHCKSYSKKSVNKIYNELFRLGHDLKKIYNKLPSNRKTLSNNEKHILNWYSKNGVSIRYNLEAYYKYNYYIKFHSGDIYVKQALETQIIKENKIKKTEVNYEMKLNEAKRNFKFKQMKIVDDSLIQFKNIIDKLKRTFFENSINKHIYYELIKQGEINSIGSLGPYEELLFGTPPTSLPKYSHDIIQKVIDEKVGVTHANKFISYFKNFIERIIKTFNKIRKF